MKNVLIVVLALATIVLASRLVHVENQRYAMVTGMCRFSAENPSWQDRLQTTDTRKSWLNHLYYGLFGS